MTHFWCHWDDAAKASARQAAVRYACDANALFLSSWSAQWDPLLKEIPAEVMFTAEMACVTAVCSFICWASTPPGAGGLP